MLLYQTEEVPGSVHYIQSNGQLNYHVILQACHGTANRECSARVCGVLLNVLNCLLDIGIIDKYEKPTKSKDQESEDGKEYLHRKKSIKSDKSEESKQKTTQDHGHGNHGHSEEKRTAHNKAMDTVTRFDLPPISYYLTEKKHT